MLEIVCKWISENQILLGLLFGIITILGFVLSIIWRKIDNKKKKKDFELMKSFFRDAFFKQVQSEIKVSIEQLANPQTWEEWLVKGAAVQLEENFDLAIKYYEKSISLHPYHKTYCYMGLAYLEKKNARKAISCLKKSIKLNPNFEDAYCGLGLVYELFYENLKVSMKLYNKALELNPNNIIALVGICSIYILENDLSKAKDCFMKIQEFNSDKLEISLLEGLIPLKEGKIINAIPYFDKMIELLPDKKKAEVLLIKKALIELKKTKQNWKSSTEQQEFKQKYIHFKKLIELDFNNSHAYYDMGNAYYDMGKYQDASKCYKRAIELSPNNENPYYDLGWLYHSVKKNNTKAANYFNRAIEINPDFAKAYNGLGSICDDKKEYKKAIEYYEKAITLDNNYTAAYNNLGAVYLKNNKYDLALKYLMKAVKITPDYLQAYVNILRAYIAKKEYYEPIKWLDQLIETRPNCPKAFFLAGFGYILTGKEHYSKGLECLQISSQLGFKLAGILAKLFTVLGYSKLNIRIGRRVFNSM